MAEERTPAPSMGDSLSPIVLLRKLDKLQWGVDILMADREKHADDKKDERFLQMEHDYRTIKRLAWAMLGAFILIGANAVASHFSLRIVDAPTPSSAADRLGSDRIPRPATATP